MRRSDRSGGSTRAAALHVAVAALVVFLLSFALTRFTPVEVVLSSSSWEAGTPRSTWITAFATLRPWWKRYAPEAVVTTASGGIEHVVRVPRRDVREIEGRPALPNRGIGYDAALGLVTAIRSAGSNNLVYDFALFVRLQQLLLAAALASTVVALALAHPSFRSPGPLAAFVATFALLSLLRPNESRFLTEGIIDSALANPLALLAVGALVAVWRGGALGSRRSAAAVAASGLFLGYATLVRAELVVVFAFALAYLAGAALAGERARLRGCALAAAAMLSLPVAYGLVNVAVFGHFVPFRMQSGQNLLEPIGQFPNPYGIEYRDEWIDEHLRERGIGYVSFEADEYLTRRYLELLVSDPLLFVRNFYARMQGFPLSLTLGLNTWTIPVALAAALAAARRDPRAAAVALPGVLAIGVLLFAGWSNGMWRLVTPVHFLTNVALCFAAAYLYLLARERLSSRGGIEER